MSHDLPEGYERHQGEDLIYVARTGQQAAIESMGLTRLPNLLHLLENGRPLGRGKVFELFPKMKEFHQALVLKQVLHGGLYGRFNPHGHRGPERLLRELATTEKARQRGVSVAEIAYLAWTVRRPCLLFLATVRVSASRNLDQVLAEEPPGPRRRRSLHAAARAVREMHDAGLFHSDLNLRNVMVTELAGDPEGFLLDLDRSWFPPRFTDDHRASNLARLLRSLQKSGALATRVPPRERLRFLQAYCGGMTPTYRALQKRIEKRARWLPLHRAAWSLGLR